MMRYTEPEIQLVLLDSLDVICTSGCGESLGGDEPKPEQF